MTHFPSLDDLLRAANPVDEGQIPEPAEDPCARLLLDKITSKAHCRGARDAHGRWVHLRVILPVLAALGALGGGAAYAVVASQPSKHLDVACYAAANLHASLAAVPASGAGPVGDCGHAWLSGEIPGHPASNPPRLDACILRSGAAGVFPDRAGAVHTCKTLGLVPMTPTPGAVSRPGSPAHGRATAPAAPTTTVAPIIVARDAIAAALSAACVDEPRARAAVQHDLAQAGLSSWTVEVRAAFTSARPCASPGFDEAKQIIYLIPIPPPAP